MCVDYCILLYVSFCKNISRWRHAVKMFKLWEHNICNQFLTVMFQTFPTPSRTWSPGNLWLLDSKTQNVRCEKLLRSWDSGRKSSLAGSFGDPFFARTGSFWAQITICSWEWTSFKQAGSEGFWCWKNQWPEVLGFSRILQTPSNILYGGDAEDLCPKGSIFNFLAAPARWGSYFRRGTRHPTVGQWEVSSMPPIATLPQSRNQ